MRALRYPTVHEDLLAALPELRLPYERLFADWDDFGGEPPGQYIVFPDTLGKLLQAALTLDDATSGRAELLRRALTFAETMFGGEDGKVEGLAIDSVAETLDDHPAGRDAAVRFGGPQLKAWFARYSRDDWKRPPADEIIDLWGVRAELDALLPATPLAEIPGISHPAEYLALDSLEHAREVDDGAVLLSTFGTTHLYVVMRAADVVIDDESLNRAAKDIAAFVGGEDPRGPGFAASRSASVSGTCTLAPRSTRACAVSPGSPMRCKRCGRRSSHTSRARRASCTSPVRCATCAGILVDAPQ